MRRKVNIPIPSSDLDYGKKPYASSTAYQGQARKVSSKLEHDRVVRQYSEFKRPQGRFESYQDMEQWANNPPGIVFPDFTVPDIPGSEYPVPDFSWGEPASFVCFCGADKCYCPGQTICFDPSCTYPIVGAQISGMVSGFTVTEKKNRICITAPENAVGPVDVNLTLLKLLPDGKGGVTKSGTCVVGKIYDKCRDEECCAGTEEMAWDSGTSAETVEPESSCIVAITDTGDGTPYTWSVSGTGFWFNAGHSITHMQTDSKVVTLYTDADACGTATITVIGCGDSQVTGEVKSTVGEWEYVGSCGWHNMDPYCGYGGCEPLYHYDHSTEIVYYGKYKYEIILQCAPYQYGHTEENCNLCFNNFFDDPCCCMFVPYGQCNDGGPHKCLNYDCLDTPTWIFDDVEELVCTADGCPVLDWTPPTPTFILIPYYHVYNWGCAY